MDTYDWSTFKKRISIKAEKEEIFTYWLSQGHLEKWFLSQAEFYSKGNIKKDRVHKIEEGDRYIWRWHGSDNVAEGEIIESNGKDTLAFTFLGCIVKVTIQWEQGEQVVELTQSDIDLDEDSRMNYFVGCSRGWTFYLTNLKSILEGGIDLRNKNKELINVINT